MRSSYLAIILPIVVAAQFNAAHLLPQYIHELNVDLLMKQGTRRTNRLINLDSSDSDFSHVEKLFYKGWKHSDKPKPRVRAVFKIQSSEEHARSYVEYQNQVGQTPSLQKSPSPGNECLLFHGTNRACRLGEDFNNTRLCGLTECCLCSIIRNSYDLNKSGMKHKFKRFGVGIYTTACSSKADDYSQNSLEDVQFRVLLLNRVVVGKPAKMRRNDPHITEPPCGYHSVIGEPGEDLNYEETVVYTDDAIRPGYLVIYGEQVSNVKSKSKVKAVIQKLFKTPLVS